PWAWGGQALLVQVVRKGRITPTGVGRTGEGRPCQLKVTDHPHGRGEDGPAEQGHDQVLGSPPRAWGGRGPPAIRVDAGRITPTGVGRTAARPGLCRVAADHPHGRGEDGEIMSASERLDGSPPRAWGGREEYRVVLPARRITPT